MATGASRIAATPRSQSHSSSRLVQISFWEEMGPVFAQSSFALGRPPVTKLKLSSRVVKALDAIIPDKPIGPISAKSLITFPSA